MTPQEVLRCLTLVDEAFDVPARSAQATKAKVALWHAVLGEFPAQVGLTATKRVLGSDLRYAPRPGQIAAEARKLLGVEPPSTEAAVGMYLSGRRDGHPAVAEAARRCNLDPRRADYGEVRWEFRSMYEAVLREHRDAELGPVREALGIDAPKVAPVVALPSPPAEVDPGVPREAGREWAARLRDEMRADRGGAA